MNKQSFSTSKHSFSTNKVLIGVIVCGLAVVTILLATKPSTEAAKSSTHQGVQAPLASPSDFPSPAPSMPSFRFDSSTDLKAELNKVNPQINGSDFDSIKKTLASF